MEKKLTAEPIASDRIRQLGGDIKDASTLSSFLLNTTFCRHLYSKDWDGWGLEELAADLRSKFDKRADQIAEIEALLKTKHKIPCGQDFWQPILYTPLTKGTDDGMEFASFADSTDLSEIYKVCGEGALTFVNIIYSYGYPDRYYVCLQDPVPENPTVFGTDRETFFQEISNCSDLNTFLHGYCDEQEMSDLLDEIYDVTF